MTAYQWSSAASINVLADYRAWGKGIHDAFIAAGLVQTTDTGQVDWATATLGVATANTTWHYEVFRFNDAAQATNPIFIRIEYGRGNSASTDVPAAWIIVGRASSGAGVITGTVLQTRTAFVGGNSTAYGGVTQYPCFVGADAGGFVMVLYPSFTPTTAANPSGFFMIERSRDATGAPTDEACVVAIGNGANSARPINVYGKAAVPGSFQHTPMYALAVVPNTINGVNLIAAGSANSLGWSKSAAVVNLLPIPFVTPGITPWVSRLVMLCHPGDVQYAPIANGVINNGTPHSYRLFPHVFQYWMGMISTISTAGAIQSAHILPGILWEA